MAGFAVIFQKDNRPPPHETAEKVRLALRAFGPDKDNVLSTGRFTTIWTNDTGYTPQDHLERQPVISEERWYLVFVGFLMHREELADKIGVARAELKMSPDSALVMKAWQKWGEDCQHHLFGPYSFVVCDTANHKLFAARSSERGTSIFYHETDYQLILATSTKAIFCDESIPKQLNETRIADALVLNYENRAQSYFQDVSILPSGHMMCATPDASSVHRVQYLAKIPDIRFANDSDYLDAANELLSRAVASSMRAVQTPAIMLSAGLDSPAVAITMLEEMAKGTVDHQGPVKGYTHVPAQFWDGRIRVGRLGNETGPVRALADRYPDLDVEFVSSDSLPFDHGLDLIQSYADMPIRGVGNLYWGMDINQRCLKAGHRVCLTGASGNATFSMGMQGIVFGALFRNGRWLRLLKEHHSSFQGSARSGYLRKLIGRAIIPNLPDWLYDIYVQNRRSDLTRGFSSFSAINADYARDLCVQERLTESGWDDRYRLPQSRKELMQIMAERGSRDEGGGMAEAIKAATGVAARDPIGDRKILEFCYAIPDDQFFKDGIDRRLVKRMMAGKLPAEVRQASRGEQSADWHGRMAKDIDRIDSELDRLSDDPVMAQRLDIPRMRKLTQNWPSKTPTSISEYEEMHIARYAIGRAVSVARFINQIEGKN